MNDTSAQVPRPSQAQVLTYTSGRMGISAVPGSGKTWTLSRLAANLVSTYPLERDQQVLVVTMSNSAAGNFQKAVRGFLQGADLGTGYRVRTLHGLAVDILSERPGLVGLSDDFQIVPEEEADSILDEALTAWLRTHGGWAHEAYLLPEELEKRYTHGKFADDAPDIVRAFIKQAKDERARPERLRAAVDAIGAGWVLAQMCVSVYEQYERGLRYRGGVDFQDLIALALTALEADPDYLARLRHRWPFVLEDEAQDSSRLQEKMLRLLVGENGNWVRVGDPNQAIYETFTTADPRFLRDFLKEEGVRALTLPESGRSAPRIIGLANALIQYSEQFADPAVRLRQPLTPPYMQPLAAGNPPDEPDAIRIQPAAHEQSSTAEREVVAKDVQAWLTDNPTKTLAILVPSNPYGTEMAALLRDMEIEHLEVLRNTTDTRKVVGAIFRIIRLISEPLDARYLIEVYRVWLRDMPDAPFIDEDIGLLRTLKRVENYILPGVLGDDWLGQTVSSFEDPERFERLSAFRSVVARWMRAALLPIDQLVLVIAGDIFRHPADIATAHSLAIHMGGVARSSLSLRLPDFSAELSAIASNAQKFVGIGAEDQQFDPARHPGKAIVMTMHGAKGLEWDRVYLMSVNNYDFPSADAGSSFRSERWYVRDSLSLQAEALAQLKSLLTGADYVEGVATHDDRVKIVAEKLRLLYVGITRAKSSLVITWNTGRESRGTKLTAAAPLPRLYEWAKRMGS